MKTLKLLIKTRKRAKWLLIICTNKLLICLNKLTICSNNLLVFFQTNMGALFYSPVDFTDASDLHQSVQV